MKNTVKTLLATMITVFLFSSVYAQTSDAYFILHKTNDKIFSQSSNGEKTVVFEIAGLSTKEEVDALVTKMKTLRGVVSVTLEETSADGKWKAAAVFYKYANKQYFPQFFKWCGIQTIEIDNIKYDTQNIEITE
ncbi:MAG: hypothetical protein V1904_02250 [Bacteroidota bacterium]